MIATPTINEGRTMQQFAKEQEIQRIVASITEAISEQKIPPGTRLIESQLIIHLHANRNHIRAALQRLAMKHLVTIKNNVGARISQPSFEEAKEIFAARLIIERGIIETLINKLTKMDVALLKKQLQKEKITVRSNNRADNIRESGNFHLLLAKLCDNLVIEELLKDLIARSSLIISLYQQQDNAQCDCNEHDQIIQHIEFKRTNDAIDCMAKHLQHLQLRQNMDLWEDTPVNLQHIFGSTQNN
jgi:DNA-binding GntR family transcriptional regulator